MKLIKFYTNSCYQCKALSEALEDFTLVPIENIDCEEDPDDLAIKYQVRGLPTLVLVNDEGEVLDKLTGLITREKVEVAVKSKQS